MAKQKLHLQVITPLRRVYDDDVDMLIMRGTEGDMGIMAGHESRTAILDIGVLRIFREGEEEQRLSVLGGFTEIKDNKVTVLSDAAEWPDEIDRVRAEAAKERAEAHLRQKSTETDVRRAENAYRRSLVRIEVSSYGVLKGR